MEEQNNTTEVEIMDENSQMTTVEVIPQQVCSFEKKYNFQGNHIEYITESQQLQGISESPASSMQNRLELIVFTKKMKEIHARSILNHVPLVVSKLVGFHSPFHFKEGIWAKIFYYGEISRNIVISLSSHSLVRIGPQCY